MSIAYAKFFPPTVLTTTAATLFTTPANPTSTLFRGGRIRLTNTSASPATATLYAVPVAGTASAGNCFLNGKSIGANDYLDIDVPIMGAGDFLQALSGTATSITAQSLAGSFFSS